MRSKQRFRQLFLMLGVIALANGVVGADPDADQPGRSWRLGARATADSCTAAKKATASRAAPTKAKA